MKLLNFVTLALCSISIVAASVAEPHPIRAAKKHHHHQSNENTHVASQNAHKRPPELPLATVKVNGQTIHVNTSGAVDVAPAKNRPRLETLPRAVGTSVSSTVLVIARDAVSAYSGYSGLRGYGIPYQVLTVPQAGVALPSLNSSATVGNFGAIVVLGEVSYDYGATGFQSALTPAQWATLYGYQLAFGVRMVRIDVYPGAGSGTVALGGCCGSGVEQLVSLTDTSDFPTAGLKTGAGISTIGMWHYPASIVNSTIAKPFLQFAPASGFAATSTAAVINNIDGRKQMVFFIPFATDWNAGSNLYQHAWIHWATRGLYAGYRRINFNTQIDDMFLTSDIYSPAGNTFRISTSDLNTHKSWVPTINAKLPAGSSYAPEIGHNGNGNIETSDDNGSNCGIGPIEYNDQIDTALEFQKPLGTGTNLWPSTPLKYPYTTTCTNGDTLKTWFATTSNRDTFYHISHTFTHEAINNATYFDVNQEITWNQAWLSQVGLSGNAARFSQNGLIPPAITGLHNGDALRAFKTNGIVNVVGDNTRPVLRNQNNEYYPLITTVSGNGYDGITVMPRWATNIYYNAIAEWIATSAGSGDFNALLALEKNTNTRNLLGLHHDPFMFHQANLRAKQATVTINGVSGQYSLLQAWVETVLGEMIRLVTWPIITLKHDTLATTFMDRMTRDACNPQLRYTINPTANTVTAITVTTNGNTCAKPIPVTVPNSVTSTSGHTTEKIGSDPLTIWVTMGGSPVTFTLSTPIPL
ncbi:hypothetical protein V502_11414 [Pseudogymnoascus sp. VKM F-4520 (FW-2644)]|nr:hypothetical protein V502_11414 [Pseudogymnoascus sp. VKM F-4520 (FW-2644)]